MLRFETIARNSAELRCGPALDKYPDIVTGSASPGWAASTCQPRIRATLDAVLALGAAPAGFTVTDLSTKVHARTGETSYATRSS